MEKQSVCTCFLSSRFWLRCDSTTDLDEVLQINSVFANVSKGELSKTSDLKKAFNTTKLDTIVLEVSTLSLDCRFYVTGLSQILQTGELQVGEVERGHDLEAKRKELATLISQRCVDPVTKRPYAVTMIEKAMTEAGFSLQAEKTAKAQVGNSFVSLLSPDILCHLVQQVPGGNWHKAQYSACTNANQSVGPRERWPAPTWKDPQTRWKCCQREIWCWNLGSSMSFVNGVVQASLDELS